MVISQPEKKSFTFSVKPFTPFGETGNVRHILWPFMMLSGPADGSKVSFSCLLSLSCSETLLYLTSFPPLLLQPCSFFWLCFFSRSFFVCTTNSLEHPHRQDIMHFLPIAPKNLPKLTSWYWYCTEDAVPCSVSSFENWAPAYCNIIIILYSTIPLFFHQKQREREMKKVSLGIQFIPGRNEYVWTSVTYHAIACTIYISSVQN